MLLILSAVFKTAPASGVGKFGLSVTTEKEYLRITLEHLIKDSKISLIKKQKPSSR